MPVEEEISKLATLLDTSTEEVQSKYDEVYPTQPLELAEVDRVERALNQVRTTLRRESRARKNSKIYEGFFVGATEVRDFMEFLRKKAANAYKENQQMAVLNGLTNNDGEALDTREKVYGKPNPHYGAVLDPGLRTYNRVLYGILRPSGGDVSPQFSKMNFGGKLAPNVDYRLYEPCYFTASPSKKQTTTYLQLNATMATKTFSGMKELPFGEDIGSVIRETCRIVPLEGLEEENQRLGEDKERIVWTEGTVDTLKLEPSPKTGSRSMLLEHPDREELVPVYIPNYVPINFTENVNVLVMGRLTVSKAREGYEGGRPQMNAYGIYIKPSQRIAMPPIEQRVEEARAQQDEYFQIGWEPAQ